MVWTPPTVPPNSRTNATPLPTNHADDHNAISDALTAIVNVLGSNPEGAEASITALVDVIDPADAIIAIAGSTAPSGWHLCDGTAVSRTLYAATFARIGTTYGAGDTSSTFNLPDLRNRFIAGKGTATWSDTLNEASGSTDAVVVTHNHTQDPHGHGNTFSASSTQGTHAHTETDGRSTSTSPGGWLYQRPEDGSNFNTMVGSALGSGGSTIQYTQPSTAAASAGTITTTISGSVSDGTATNQAAGVSGTNANLPPYRTLNYCIRIR